MVAFTQMSLSHIFIYADNHTFVHNTYLMEPYFRSYADATKPSSADTAFCFFHASLVISLSCLFPSTEKCLFASADMNVSKLQK